jgi:glycosyltransferase involved in cell wall biosynthesis
VLLVDATTAEHARGIRTVSLGILGALAKLERTDVVVAAGPSTHIDPALRARRIALAKTRVGRLGYQRLLLPADAKRAGAERVLMLDAYAPFVRVRRLRYAALVHDVLPLSHPQYWSRAKLAVKRVAFSTLRHSDVTLFTSSEHTAAEIRRQLGVTARVIRFGCGQLTDEEANAALAAPLPARGNDLVCVGALEPRKGIPTLLEAFDLLVAGGADLRLVLAGDGLPDYTAELRSRIGGNDRVSILGRLSRTEVLERIAGAAALVMPSEAEGFGLPVLEAIALGTPSVASDIPAFRSWAGDSARYATPGRPRDWVEPILAAIDANEAERRAGQHAVADRRWRVCADEVVSF